MIRIIFKIRYFQMPMQKFLQKALYGERDLIKDHVTIYNILKQKELFGNYSIQPKVDVINKTMVFSIVGVTFSEHDKLQAHDSQKYLRFQIHNQLNLYGLTRYYFMSNFGFEKKLNDKLISYKFDREKLVYINSKREVESRLKKIKFPEESIPKKFLDIITIGIMDVPVYDVRRPNELYDEMSLKNHFLTGQSVNHFTRKILRDYHIKYDLVLRDEILNFVEKAEYCQRNNLKFTEYMSQITDNTLSCKAFCEKLNPRKVSLIFDDYVREGLQAYKNGRFLNAIYFLKQTIWKIMLNKTGNKNHAVIIGLADSYMHRKRYQDAEDLIQLFPNLIYPELKLFLIRIYLHQKKYDNAKKILTKETKVDHLPEIEIQYKRLSYLTTAKVADNYAGYCQGLRKYSVASTTNFEKYLSLFPEVDINAQDTNPKKKYTALHLILIKGKLNNAKILIKRNARLDIKSVDGKTAFEMICQSKEKKVQALLTPYVSFKLTTKSKIDFINDNELLHIKEILGLPTESGVSYIADKSLLVIYNFFIEQPTLLNVFVKFIQKTFPIHALIKEKFQTLIVKPHSYNERNYSRKQLYDITMIFKSPLNVEHNGKTAFFSKPVMLGNIKLGTVNKLLTDSILKHTNGLSLEKELTHTVLKDGFLFSMESCPIYKGSGEFLTFIANESLRNIGMDKIISCSQIKISDSKKLVQYSQSTPLPEKNLNIS